MLGKGKWQREMGRYLQKSLRKVCISDRFLVQESKDIVGFLKNNTLQNAQVFSLNVSDLFFVYHRGSRSMWSVTQ